MKSAVSTLVALTFAAAALVARADLIPVKPETFLLNPGQPSTLVFKTAKPEPAANLAFVVRNYSGVEVLRGQGISRPDDAIQIDLKLPAGYYDLTFPASGQSFGLAALPPIDSKPDPFFCFDAALSWGAPDPQLRQSYIAMLHRLNVDTARERMLWGAVNALAGKYDWETDKRYQSVRQDLFHSGVHVLEMCHDAAPYLRNDTRVPYPFDLAHTASAFGDIAGHWQEYDAGMEAWNEPDIEFGADLPADQYVPMVKAASAGFQKANIRTPLGGGIFTEMAAPTFLQACGRSGLFDQVDFVSCHNYDAGMSIEPQILKLRRHLKEYGKESMPLWITECGSIWKTGPPRPQLKDDARAAMEICAKAVEARACGVKRYFPFVLFFYIEGPKNYSMTDKDGTPMRSLAAYGQCINILSGKRYIGDLAKPPTGIQRARVFGDDAGEAVVVLYSGAVTPGATTHLDFSVDRILGIDGRKQASKDGKIPIQDGLIYLVTQTSQIQPLLKTDTIAATLNQTAQRSPPVRSPFRPTVLQFLPDLDKLHATTTGYLVSTDIASHLQFRVHATNFSAGKQSVKISLSADGTPANQGPAYSKTIEIEPDQVGEAAWDVDLSRFGGASRKAIRIVAESAGQAVDQLLVRIGIERSVAEHLAAFADSRPLPIVQARNWANNVAPGGTMEMSVAENGWSMQAKFDKGERWVYPVFTLPSPIDLPHASGFLIRAKASGAGVVKLLVQEKNKSGYFLRGALIPSDGRFHTVLVPFDDLSPQSSRPADPNGQLDPDQIQSLEIGMHSEAAENGLEISDLYVAGATK